MIKLNYPPHFLILKIHMYDNNVKMSIVSVCRGAWGISGTSYPASCPLCLLWHSSDRLLQTLCVGISPPRHDILSLSLCALGFSATSTWESHSNLQGLWANQGVWENKCPSRRLMTSRFNLGSRSEPRWGTRGHNWCDQCSKHPFGLSLAI